MSSLRKQVSFLAVISMLVSLSCMAVTRLISNAPPPATATPAEVLLTATPAAVATSISDPTKETSSSCNAEQTLRNLKSKVAYDEFVLYYNKVKSTSFLIIWFVDPEINPAAKESELAKNADLAIRDALILSQELKASDACTGKLFDVINAIVVDKNYNGWLSGQIKIEELPETVQTGQDQLAELSRLYEKAYLRNKVTKKLGSAPAGSCKWTEAKKNIYNHFSSERENIAFYFVLDESGANIYAQWDGQPDFVQATLPAALMNIAMEINCLFPEPDRIIFNIVDETGEMQIIGAWNGSDAKNQDISQIQILYQK
jgi:hypothetical protein